MMGTTGENFIEIWRHGVMWRQTCITINDDVMKNAKIINDVIGIIMPNVFILLDISITNKMRGQTSH